MAWMYKMNGMGIPACAGMTVWGFRNDGWVMAWMYRMNGMGIPACAGMTVGGFRNDGLGNGMDVQDERDGDSGLRRNDGWRVGMTV